MIYTIFMQVTQMHHIQKHILKTLCFNKWSRFRDMRPKNTDSNLYNYHLRLLLKANMIEKVDGKGYRLSPDGLRFVDHASLENVEPRWQPKITTQLVSIKDDGVLLWPKMKQPFIGTWSLPNGKMHYDDTSVETAMRREISYFANEKPTGLKSRGVIEYNASINGIIVSHTIAHIFTAVVEDVSSDRARWVSMNDLAELKATPGTVQAIAATQNESGYFYKYYDIDW